MRLPKVGSLRKEHDLLALYHAFYDVASSHAITEPDATEEITSAWLMPAAAQRLSWARRRGDGLAKVRLLLNRGACPFAIEATAALVAAMSLDLQDTEAKPSSSAQRGRAESAARLAHAMALVRFVNGVVDEHQTGLFAESISTIAAKVGLPLWLVEVRHAATHQDCPTIQVLREANVAVCWSDRPYDLARDDNLAPQAMRWLQDHFWLQAIAHLPAGDVGVVQATESGVSTDTIGDSRNAVAVMLSRASALVDPSAAAGPQREEVTLKLPQGWRKFQHGFTTPLGHTVHALDPMHALQ